MLLVGLHHITCVCSDAQQTLDFYRDRLGFTLVKKTVNFDDPHSYHLYFGDEPGRPGTLITFFEWPRAEPGRLGRGTLESIGLASPSVAGETEIDDPDGLRLRLYPGEAPGLRDVVVIGNPDLYVGLFSPDAPLHVRGAGRGGGADRRRDDASHRLAHRPTTRSSRPGSSVWSSSACARRRCRTASTSVSSTSACPTAC